MSELKTIADLLRAIKPSNSYDAGTLRAIVSYLDNCVDYGYILNTGVETIQPREDEIIVDWEPSG